MPKRKRDSDEEESAVESLAESEISEEKPKKKKKATKPSKTKEPRETAPKGASNTEEKTVDGIRFNVTGGESWLDLGSKKRVTVREFKGKTLVDIREFYEDRDSGEMKPGKKGVALSSSEWHELARIAEAVSSLVAGTEK